MRANRRFFGRSYLKSYHDNFSISEPVEEHDARLALTECENGFIPLNVAKTHP